MGMIQFFLLIFCMLAITEARPSNSDDQRADPSPTNCGYASCPKPKSGVLNIHLVPHSHDDVGWLKTVDQYYYGSKTSIQRAGVQYILDSVIQELLKNPKRKFIQVESAFFFMWWNEQTPELQEQVKKLVNRGQLEFAGGAWSMNDEASTHYQSIIDQFSLGLKLLNDTFGECGRPRVGWQIDPFGHSREMASIFARMNFDGLFFARLDYEEKGQRLSGLDAEMLWHGSEILGAEADLFTGTLFNHYSAPPGFCFDVLCSDEPIIDGKRSPDNNVKKRTSDFVKYVNRMAKFYRTNNLLVPMGDDFNYQDANMMFKNIDKLIKYTNELHGNDVNVFYSSPACYVKALHDQGITWPIKKYDFFPYSTDPHTFWSGYFTSRPTLKRFERIGNHFLQVCKQLTANGMQQVSQKSREGLQYNLDYLRDIMGIMQHHDAITGTEKELVAYDYALQLDNAIKACHVNTKAVLNLLSAKTIGSRANFDFQSCFNLNISQCEISEQKENFMVTLYNPLSYVAEEYVHVPVPDGSYTVRNSEGDTVSSQLLPIPTPVEKLSFRYSNAEKELVFLADKVPPHGFKSFYVSLDQRKSVPTVQIIETTRPKREASTVVIGNENLQLTFINGILTKLKTNEVEHNLRQEFYYYEGALGDNEVFAHRSSGAYIFRPNGTEKLVADHAKFEVFRGEHVEEVQQTFNEWISQVVRVYKKTNHIEFEWLIGSIPVLDRIGKEVITRITSDIQSNSVFFTDSNGREMIRRIRNWREYYRPTLAELVSGNYYPVTTRMTIFDVNKRLSIFPDRAVGGSSLADGTMEIMLHRRLLHDDAFGVGEALNEKAYGHGLIARGKYYVSFGPNSYNQIQDEYALQLEKLLPFWKFFSDVSSISVNDWKRNFINDYSDFLSKPLPENINLMTVEPWGEGKLLVRFEYVTDLPLDAVSLNVLEYFEKYGFSSARETTLDGAKWLDESTRMVFNPDSPVTDNEAHSVKYDRMNDRHDDSSDAIIIKPMEIRTFVLSK